MQVTWPLVVCIAIVLSTAPTHINVAHQVPENIDAMGTIRNKVPITRTPGSKVLGHASVPLTQVRELLTQRKVANNKQQVMKRRRVKNDEDRQRAREFKLGRGRGRGETVAQLDPLHSGEGTT